jgi:hypothetical protein
MTGRAFIQTGTYTIIGLSTRPKESGVRRGNEPLTPSWEEYRDGDEKSSIRGIRKEEF